MTADLGSTHSRSFQSPAEDMASTSSGGGSLSGSFSGLANLPSSSGSDASNSIAHLLMRIGKLRKKEMCIDPDDFTVVSPADKHIWAKMFVEYLLVDYAQGDDMLWCVSSLLGFCTPRPFFGKKLEGCLKKKESVLLWT